MTRSQVVELRRSYLKMMERNEITPQRYWQLMKAAWDTMSDKNKEIEYENCFWYLITEGWQDTAG